MTTRFETLLARAQLGASSLAIDAPLGQLPFLIRFSLGDVFAQARYGEQAAHACAETLVALETEPVARAFAQTQVREEASHVAFFGRLERELGIARPVLPPLRRLFDEASQASDLPNLLLGTHVVVETLAHELFRELAGTLHALGSSRLLPSAWASSFSAVSRALQGVYRDESRHCAFGVLRLAQLRAESTDEGRKALDAAAKRWLSRLEETLDEVPVLFLLVPRKRRLARRIVERAALRCRDAGLEVG